MYGFLNGPSQDNSEVAPSTKPPDDIITGSSYPGIWSAIGVKLESTLQDSWIAFANNSNFLLECNFIAWTISLLGSSNFGIISYPKSSKTFAKRRATFIDSIVVLLEKYKPCKTFRFVPKLNPSSFPIPGAVRVFAQYSIKSFLPEIYPPVIAIPPPRFLIKEPAIISAPISIGSLISVNSP